MNKYNKNRIYQTAVTVNYGKCNWKAFSIAVGIMIFCDDLL